jgi:hypothetical protein
MSTKRRRVAGLSLALLVFALLVASAQAGAAKPQLGKVKQTAKPVQALAMDGSRVAYLRSDRRVGVWNLVTGTTSLVKGDYPSRGIRFGHGSGEVAIAGTRVALITRFVTGNSLQTQERLYTASVGGFAHQLGTLTNHSTNPQLCEQSDPGLSWGDWIAGVVGSGKVLAVSTWKATDTVSSNERLSLVTPTGLRTIVAGPDAIVAQSADSGHLAVLRATSAWPPTGEVGPGTSTPAVGIYSGHGTLLGEIALPSSTISCGIKPRIEIALSGNQLVVLTRTPPARAMFAVYDWTTGTLLHTWAQQRGGCDTFAAAGRLVAYPVGCGFGGTQRLHLLDLRTGKDVVIAHGPGQGGYITAMDSRGLVYSANPYVPTKAKGKLVFMPTAKLLAALRK